MVGRRVVTSSSEDEAERPSRRLSCLAEEELLQPVSKDLHPDNWPCFVLNGAIVYGKDGVTQANLLHAELEGPFSVRGKLEVDKEFRHLRKISFRNGQGIEVTDVKGFSMGLGPVTIWANGKAGWFEIRPATTYQHVFDKMSEGLILYYFLIDLYESKKKGIGVGTLTIEKIFEDYATQFDSSMSLSQVADRCEEHAVFLLSQMRKQGEPIRWSHTTFYRWLVEKRRDIYNQYHVKPEPAKVSEQMTASYANQTAAFKKGGNAMLSATTLPDRSKVPEAAPTAIVSLMLDLHKTGKILRTRMNIRRLSRAIFQSFDVESEKMARAIIEVNAESILLAIDKRWSRSPIYEELEQIRKVPQNKTIARRKAKDLALNLRPVKEPILNSEKGESSHPSLESNRIALRRKRSLQSSEDESPTMPEEEIESEQGGRARRKQSLESNVRSRNYVLTLSKAEGSIIEARHTMTTRSRSSSDEDINPAAPLSNTRHRRGPSRSGKVAALRLIGSSPAMKRFSPEFSDSEFAGGPSRKRPRISNSAMNDDSEITLSSNDFETHLEEDESGDDEVEMGAMEGLTLTSEPILSSSPQGPNGLWTCQKEGCSYKVGFADKPDGRAKVQAHFLEHADEIARREALVLEESKPYLPTSHLLEMIRSLGESARLAEERKIGGRPIPQPIKKRLAI